VLVIGDSLRVLGVLHGFPVGTGEEHVAFVTVFGAVELLLGYVFVAQFLNDGTLVAQSLSDNGKIGELAKAGKVER
jgi:Tfp pilus tip-associated adhesin PilY1